MLALKEQFCCPVFIRGQFGIVRKEKAEKKASISTYVDLRRVQCSLQMLARLEECEQECYLGLQNYLMTGIKKPGGWGEAEALVKNRKDVTCCLCFLFRFSWQEVPEKAKQRIITHVLFIVRVAV